ncbi:MAG TPA: maleylacetoacetate isomerase [Myxococcales bacterium]|nr:maleylacetoacetate isomerase [Myxococcales bacterium]
MLEAMPNVAVMPRPTVLHGYFRSAASWRVRIALGLKGVAVRPVFHHLRRGEQRDAAYLALNPQGLVPALELDDGTVLTQSLAIIEWLDDAYPEPKLLPADPVRRARVRAFALVLAADTHPLQNLGVLARLRGMGRPEAEVQAWAADANAAGLAACEALLEGTPGPFCFGAAPTLADICLVPQLGNARRFGVDVTRFPRLLAAEAACLALSAFADAVPDRQPDAE